MVGRWWEGQVGRERGSPHVDFVEEQRELVGFREPAQATPRRSGPTTPPRRHRSREPSGRENASAPRRGCRRGWANPTGRYRRGRAARSPSAPGSIEPPTTNGGAAVGCANPSTNSRSRNSTASSCCRRSRRSASRPSAILSNASATRCSVSNSFTSCAAARALTISWSVTISRRSASNEVANEAVSSLRTPSSSPCRVVSNDARSLSPARHIIASRLLKDTPCAGVRRRIVHCRGRYCYDREPVGMGNAAHPDPPERFWARPAVW